MATTKNKKAFNIMAVVYAAGGGMAAGVLTSGLEKNMAFLADKPKVTPLIVTAVGTAGLYFAPEEYAPAFYGMIGAAGGDLGMQFLSDRAAAKSLEAGGDFYLPEAEINDLLSQNIEMPGMTKELMIGSNADSDPFWSNELT